MKHLLAILTLVLLTACPMAGEPWGRCLDETECTEGFVCHGQYAGDASNVITMCIAVNPSNDPAQCPDAFIAGETFDTVGVSTCRIPCEMDCYPEIGVVCGVTGSCGWVMP